MPAITHNTTGQVSLTATATAINQHARVKIDSSGTISAAGATDISIGTAMQYIAASGLGTVRLNSAPGTQNFIASVAISVGDRLYAAASGKVTNVNSGGIPLGYQASVASGADGDIIEAIPTEGAALRYHTLAFPIDLASITGAQDVVTGYVLPFGGSIINTQFFVNAPGTGTTKAATLNLEIGTTNVTGGEVALTTDNTATMGARLAGTAITAANTFAAGDTLSVEAASVTAFTGGSGTLFVTLVQN